MTREHDSFTSTPSDHEPIRAYSANVNSPSTLNGVGPRLFLTGEHVGTRVVVTRSVRIEALIGERDRVSVVTAGSDEPEPMSPAGSDALHPRQAARVSAFMSAASVSGRSAVSERPRAQPPTVRAPAPAWLVVGSVIALAGAAVLALHLFGDRYVVTRTAQVDARVAPVSPRLVGTLQRVHVRPNQKVHAGDLLAELEASEQQLRVDAALANLEAASAAISGDDVAIPSDLAGATAALSKFEAKLSASGREQSRLASELGEQQAKARKLERELAEQQRAFQSGAHVKGALDIGIAALGLTHNRMAELQLAQAASIARAQQLTASATGARQRIDELERARRERRDSARAASLQLTAAKARYDEALRQLARTKIYAPFDGVVSAELASAGDSVSPTRPLLSLWQSTALWVTASIDENELPHILEGQAARLHVRALDLDLLGQVESVAFGSEARLQHAAGGFANYDATAPQRVPVRIALQPGQPGSERLRPGMTVDTRVLVH